MTATVEINDIREGLVANLAGIPDCQKLPYRTGNENPPTLVVWGFDEITRTSFGAGGGAEIPMRILGIAGKTTTKGAQVKLDKWLSPFGATNVWDAITSDPTLGGKVSQVVVLSCDGSQVLTLENGTEVLGTTWHIRIDL